jgi:hypothetical protein
MMGRELLRARVEPPPGRVAEPVRFDEEAAWQRVRLVLGALERSLAERPGRLYGAPRQVA